MPGQESLKKNHSSWREKEIDPATLFFIKSIWDSPMNSNKIWDDASEELMQFSLEEVYAFFERYEKLKLKEEYEQISNFVSRIFTECIYLKLEELHDNKDEVKFDINDSIFERELLFQSRYLNAIKIHDRFTSLVSSYYDSITDNNDFGITIRQFNWASGNLLVKQWQAKGDLTAYKVTDPKWFNYFLLVYSFEEWKVIVETEVLSRPENQRYSVLNNLTVLLNQFRVEGQISSLNYYNGTNWDIDKNLRLTYIETTEISACQKFIKDLSKSTKEAAFEKIFTPHLKDIWKDFLNRGKKMGLSEIEISHLITSMFKLEKMIYKGKAFIPIYCLETKLILNISQKESLRLLIIAIWEKYLMADKNISLSKKKYIENWNFILIKLSSSFSISNLYKTKPKDLKK